MNFEDLTPEQQEKALACKTTEELVELAKSEGVDLTDEQLSAVAGGDASWNCCTHDACNDNKCVTYEPYW